VLDRTPALSQRPRTVVEQCTCGRHPRTSYLLGAPKAVFVMDRDTTPDCLRGSDLYPVERWARAGAAVTDIMTAPDATDSAPSFGRLMDATPGPLTRSVDFIELGAAGQNGERPGPSPGRSGGGPVFTSYTRESDVLGRTLSSLPLRSMCLSDCAARYGSSPLRVLAAGGGLQPASLTQRRLTCR